MKNTIVKYVVLFVALMTWISPALASLQLTWDDNSTNEDGVKIWRWEGGRWYYLIATLPPNSQSYLDKNVRRNREYCYIVTTFNSVGEKDSAEKCNKAP